MKRRLLLLVLTLLAVAACGTSTATPTATIASPTITSQTSPAPLASTFPSPVVTPQPAAAAPTPSPVPTLRWPDATPVVQYGRIARSHIEALTKIGPRVAGTAAEGRAAAYIASIFDGAGYTPQVRPFRAIDDYGHRTRSVNVVAVKTGRSAREIVVGAHYDSVKDGRGADDNASGVAVMLEVAELLKDETTPYTIRFVAFGAEEVGMLGSNAYVSQMSKADRANTVAMVNLDSVMAGDIAYIYSDEGGRAALRNWTMGWASRNGFDLRTIRNVDLSDPEGGGSSDYAAFQQAGIPFVYFETTNWNLGDKDGYTQVNLKYGARGIIRHTRYDTLAYLDATFPGRVDADLKMFAVILHSLLTQYQ